MAARPVDYLIVGGGVAGFSCARTLREEGADGTVVVVSRDPDPPYDRTACSKGYLRGSQSRADTLLAAPDWWDGHDVELLARTSALKLDPAEKTVTLSNKDTVRYGKLLVATGANVRRLRLEGSDLQGIHYLRALGNADAIRRAAEDAERIVLVGGSYIATEVAATLTSLGKPCVLVMQEDVTLERGFGRRVGRFFQGLLEQHGVEVHPGQDVECFEGVDGRVTAVVTRSGRRIAGDVVVVGAGVMPDVMLVQRAGLELGPRGGVRTNASLRTSAPDVFAAGDMCEYESVVHAGARLRIEHWDVAEQQGRTAALAMLERDARHDVVPYFFSDLADWSSMEYVGPANTWDEELVRGSVDDGIFTVFYVHEGRVAGALTVGRSEDLNAARALIASRADVADRREQLADPSSDLATLADASS